MAFQNFKKTQRIQKIPQNYIFWWFLSFSQGSWGVGYFWDICHRPLNVSPNAFIGRSPSRKSPKKQPIRKRGIKRFLRTLEIPLFIFSKQGSTLPLGRGVCETKSKKERPKHKKIPSCIGLTALEAGLRPCSKTIVSEGASPCVRGRSEFAVNRRKPKGDGAKGTGKKRHDNLQQTSRQY